MFLTPPFFTNNITLSATCGSAPMVATGCLTIIEEGHGDACPGQRLMIANDPVTYTSEEVARCGSQHIACVDQYGPTRRRHDGNVSASWTNG